MTWSITSLGSKVFRSIFRKPRPTPTFRRPRSILRVEELEARVTPVANPVVSLSSSTSALLNTQSQVSLTFANSGTTSGYSPYAYVVLPRGVDGDDGLTFVTGSANYLGASIDTTVVTVGVSGQAQNPYANDASGNPLIVTANQGDQVVFFRYPFGSFASGQPDATINFNVNVSANADAGVALQLRGGGGFALGNDEFDNAASDPPIQSSEVTSSVTPTVYTITKTYLGPEGETATGPSYQRGYRVDVRVAPGQTLTDFSLSDVLDNNVQYVNVINVSANGSTVTTTPASNTATTTTPGGTVARAFDQVVGDSSSTSVDASMEIRFYIPRDDSSNQAVLPLNTGAADTSTNQAQGSGTWDPIDSRDPTVSLTQNSNTVTITDRSVATQKSVRVVSGGTADGSAQAGATLEYTIDVQVSDYFAFDQVVLDDVIGDAQDFDTTFTPTMSVVGRNASGNAAMSGANYTVNPTRNVDGTLNVQFRISDEQATRGNDTRFIGGEIASGGTGSTSTLPDNDATSNSGPATIRVTFRTRVRDQHYVRSSANNNTDVKQGDALVNSVAVTGRVLNYADLTPYSDNRTVSDTSSTSTSVPVGTVTKSIYAVNGSTAFDPNGVLKPGDQVTYRITYTMPTSDVENLVLTDYLPSPVFRVGTGGQSITFTGNTAGTPANGEAQWGPSDTYHTVFASEGNPTTTTDASTNTVRFQFPANLQANPSGSSTTVDILFTVTITDDPFADGLFLTNQVNAQERDTSSTSSSHNGIIQISLGEPVVTIQKAAVSSSNTTTVGYTGSRGPNSLTFNQPGSTSSFTGSVDSQDLDTNPIDSNINGLQAGDRVRFAIIVRNTGSSANGAYDVTITDNLPAGFKVASSGLNLTVTNGNGTSVGFTDLGGGLFGNGIRLNDSTTGAIAAANPTSGTDIIIITYDLEVENTTDTNPAQVGQTITNTANVTRYASVEGGDNFVQNPINDPATATIINPRVDKQFTSTSIVNANNTNAQAVIGEVVTYTLVVTVPQGVSPNTVIQDALANNVTYLDLVSITSSSTAISYTGTPTSPTTTNSGRTVSFNFGTITNTNLDSTTSETITIVYRAIVRNTTQNQGGQSKANTARVFVNNTQVASDTDNTLRIIEPNVTTSKSVQINGQSNTPGKAGDAVTYTITLQNNSGAAAYNVTFSDVLPDKVLNITLDSVTNSDSSNPVGSSDFTIITTGTTRTLQTSSSDGITLLPNQQIVITLSGILANSVLAGESIANTATTQWTSLPTGDPNQNEERTGNGTTSGDPNDYRTSGTATITIRPIGATKSVVATDNPNTGTSQFDTIQTDATIGETVTYRITLQAVDGVNPLTLTDTLPSGMTYISSRVVSIGGNTTLGATSGGDLSGSSLAVGASGSETSNVITFNFGTLNNTTNNGSADSDTIVVEVVARVSDVGGNSGVTPGTQLTNTAVVNFGNGTTTATSTIDVVEPRLTITKSSTPTRADAQDVIDYQVVIRHATNSTAPAYDITVTDTLETGLEIVSGSIASSAGTVSVSGQTISVNLSSLQLGETVTLTYQVRVATTATAGDTLSNTATVNYDSMPGNDSVDRNGTTSATNDLNINRNAIRGFVYIDADNDGIFDSGETPLSGQSVTLSGTDHLGNSVSLTAITQSDGSYVFDNLRPGTYRLTETQPSGYLSGRNTVGSNFGGTAANPPTSEISNIVIPKNSNTTGQNYNFGELQPASISGRVYNDFNNNGVPNTGEPGISGVSVTLTGTDAFGASVLLATTTANDGSYSFGNLLPGTYVVSESQPSTYNDGTDRVGTINGTTVGTQTASGSTDVISAITLNSGQSGVNYDFGELGTSISGLVWLDSDKDGNLDAGETGRQGNVVITLLDANNNLVATTQSLSDGSYQFSNLPAGSYTIVETIPTGYGSSTTTSRTVNVPLTGLTDQNFGLTTASIAGVVYVDVNNNGTLDNGETRLPGITISLAGTDANGAAVIRSAITGSDGTYRIDNLLAGTYQLTEPQPNSYADGSDTIGSAGGVQTAAGANDVISNIVLGAAVDATNYNFGELGATLAGTVWVDLNRDGVLDSSEADRLGGVTITLVNTIIPQIFTTITDSSGNYLVADLPAGTYIITETQPAGYGSSTSNTITLVVQPNSTNQNLNFGETFASLAGSVYVDANNNGVRDSGEQGIASVTVTLAGTDATGASVNRTATTDSNGNYLFDRLLASGSNGYTLTEPLPSGYSDGGDTIGSAGGTQTQTGSSDVISSILLGTGAQATGYNFGETQADLAVTKTVSNSKPQLNESVTFTITVRNNGPTQATNVVLTDQIPSTLGNISVSTTQGSYDTTNGRWSIGTMDVGAEVTMTILATVTTTGVITNTASVTSDMADPNTSNNESSAQTETRQADLQIEKVVNTSNITWGSLLFYTFVINNRGPDTATNVVVDDVFPDGLVFVQVQSVTQGSYDPNTGRWTIGTMANGQQDRLTVIFQVSKTGEIVNRADVSALEVDPDLSNNRSAVTVASSPDSTRVSKRGFLASTPQNGSRMDMLTTQEIRSMSSGTTSGNSSGTTSTTGITTLFYISGVGTASSTTSAAATSTTTTSASRITTQTSQSAESSTSFSVQSSDRFLAIDVETTTGDETDEDTDTDEVPAEEQRETEGSPTA